MATTILDRLNKNFPEIDSEEIKKIYDEEVDRSNRDERDDALPGTLGRLREILREISQAEPPPVGGGAEPPPVGGGAEPEPEPDDVAGAIIAGGPGGGAAAADFGAGGHRMSKQLPSYSEGIPLNDVLLEADLAELKKRMCEEVNLKDRAYSLGVTVDPGYVEYIYRLELDELSIVFREDDAEGVVLGIGGLPDMTRYTDNRALLIAIAEQKLIERIEDPSVTESTRSINISLASGPSGTERREEIRRYNERLDGGAGKPSKQAGGSAISRRISKRKKRSSRKRRTTKRRIKRRTTKRRTTKRRTQRKGRKKRSIRRKRSYRRSN